MPSQLPLLGRVFKRDVVSTEQHSSDLVQTLGRQEPPQTSTIPTAPHKSVELVHALETFRVGFCVFAVSLQPSVWSEDVGVWTVDVAIAGHD